MFVFSCKNTKKVNAFTKIVKYFTFLKKRYKKIVKYL